MNTNLTQFDSGASDHKMTWTHEKMHLAESVDESRMKFQRNSVSSAAKSIEKFDLFKKLHELYNELSRDESSQANYVSDFFNNCIFYLRPFFKHLYFLNKYICT